jgi:cytochrome c-type biogenesis protein CcmH/NrfG
MDYGGEQKPGTAMGARARAPRRGRQTGTGPELSRSARRRSSAGYVLAALAVLALWGAWSLAVVGCTGPWPGYGRTGENPCSVLAYMRQSPEEISRLERNAHYYKLMGQPELGLKEMELAHQENPDNLQITDLLAQNYEEQGKFEAARQLYQEGLTRHGPHAVLANNLCFSYYHEGRWEEAETCFRQTLDRDPGNVAARNNLGLLYCRLGRQDEARRLWQEAEGVAVADAKMSQALAVLGMPESAVYARRPEPTPPAAGVTQAPTPEAAASRLPAPMPAKPDTPAQPVAQKKSTAHLATKPQAPTPAPVAIQPAAPATAPVAVKPAAPTPAPVVTKPPAPTPAVVAATPSAPTPAPVAAKPPAPTPAPVAAKSSASTSVPVAAQPQPEPRKQAVVAQKALAAAAPAPAPPAASRPPQTPLTATERVDTAIEVRNGTWTKDLARQTRSLLHREGFTVAKIGNHVDFGAAKTIIYYRPEAERVAQALGHTIFPPAGLEPSSKLTRGIDVKVLLGHDLQENAQFMARLNDGGAPAAPLSTTPAATDTLVAAKTEAEPPAGHQEPPGKSRAAAKAEQQPLAPQPKEVAAQPLTSPAPTHLTAAELMDTAIEIRNGTWTKNLAHRTRSLLSQEGFTVAMIGNHIDFGATKTVIYYRPGAERVARAVGATVFPPAELEPSLKLKKGTDIKILLGADLLQRPLLMARLFAGDI